MTLYLGTLPDKGSNVVFDARNTNIMVLSSENNV